MLRVGVIGCGRIVQEVHLPVLAGLSDVQVVALADPDSARREAVRWYAPAAETYDAGVELLGQSGLDCVVIAAPSQLHAQLATEAMRRGLHVYLEKPIGTTIEEGEMLLEIWEQRRLVGMVGFNYRFHPVYESARELLKQGVVGKPLAVSSVFVSSAAVQGQWRATRSRGGGVLLDLASHHVDITHFLFDDLVAEVRAQTFSGHSDEATATLQMRMESGMLVSSTFSYGTVDEDRYEIYGDRGLLRIDRHLSVCCQLIPVANQRARLRQIASALGFVWHPGIILDKRRAAGHEPSYAKAMQAFVTAIREKRLVEPSLSDGYRALAVIAAAEDSARTGSATRVFARKASHEHR
jgi:predicted dehydrogenase